MAATITPTTLIGSSGQLAKDLRLAMRDSVQAAITAGKTQWAIVDDGYVNSTSERTVFTNTNGFAIMVVNNTVQTTLVLNILIGSDYNSTTHTLNNVSFVVNNSNQTANSTGYSGVNYNPTTTQLATNTPAVSFSYNAWQPTINQSQSLGVVETDYLIFSVKNADRARGQVLYAGFATSLVGNSTLTDTYPAVLFNNLQTASGIYSGIGILQSLGNNSISLIHAGQPRIDGAIVATTSLPDKYQDNTANIIAQEIEVVRETPTYTNVTSPNLYGWRRAKLKDSVYIASGNAAWGDTVTIAGSVYTYLGGTGNTIQNTTNGFSIWVKTGTA